jgi:CHU_C Type IX secretion signal domain
MAMGKTMCFILRVYDRWGALVYLNRDYDNTWDGGKQADGTYFFIFETEKSTIKGWVQLVR